MHEKLIKEFCQKTEGLKAPEIIRLADQEFGRRVSFASSLGEEDQVITDIIAGIAPQMEIFTLDTGRLFPETYDLIAKTQKRYPMPFKIYYPETTAVQEMVKSKGINLFYESVENRKLCCGIRKVEPLRRALAGVDAWICGLRRGQSVTRSQVDVFEWDEQNMKIKVNPLAHWTLDDVRAYINAHQVDVSPLHALGFLSIGCSCCTRAVKPGEDIRAGRWWWEQPQQKECGLHNNPNRPPLKKT
ncbi:MAG: phosphoadenylyl-sulfate reductase [Candidatus Omnitrophota bacterium]|nr:phosphoadenylyl-sulfate reductase [Candidatus Omnitrophota bacterium]MDZ4242289.1 phosphoadenylyl-sulfate reductase [Candidatus Omnitrophota bacterium]